MNEGALLDHEIKYLQDEITSLKTAHVKTASKISTMELNKSINLSLMLDPVTTEIFSSQRAIITMTSSNSTNFISACYLDGMTPSSLNSRFVYVNRISSASGQCKYEVVVYSQNPDDYTTLSCGGSVNLTYNLKLIGSSKFTATIDYRNITGGSS